MVAWHQIATQRWERRKTKMASDGWDDSVSLLFKRLSDWSPRPSEQEFLVRQDGRHVLEPMVCSVDGRRSSCLEFLESNDIKNLHNEGALGAEHYPLRSEDGLFFTESLGGLNPQFDKYQRLVLDSISTLRKRGTAPLSISELEACGAEIQMLDTMFASELIGRPLDALHRCVGPDPSHPYSKITVCRTTFPVEIGGEILRFYFEKFLVSYSYLDSDGTRRSTTTPIHSHPMNFETVYFTSHGSTSCVLEQEFELLTDTGEPLITADGSLDEGFVRRVATVPGLRPQATPGAISKIWPSSGPIRLTAFDSETVLKSRRDLIEITDGLFRPHQVTVIDDPDAETRYFALDNYFGPVGRVLLYDPDGTVNVWSHDAWDHS
ncbi:MAG: hypothetical protein NTX13_04380 [Acidobacteria bacterium]|nr:hypothetical protein [Acidobacteriota bacterium]